MSYLVLARKYRPQTFAEIVKQEHVTITLLNAIKADRIAHAMVFAGQRGTGKTTIARILAKAMNCFEQAGIEPCNECRACKEITYGNSPDVLEIDGASNNGVEQIRELRDNAKYMPSYSKFKIYIIDEVHMLSAAAFNALLKTLEEPPSHVLFFFATTEPRKIPITILSRCQRHDLRRIDIVSIVEHMAVICKKEGINIADETLSLIAREGTGSMRDSLSLLDHVISCCTNGDVAHEYIIKILGIVDRKIIFSLSDYIINGNVGESLTILEDIYFSGCDLKKLYSDILQHFRDLLFISMQHSRLVDASPSEVEIMSEQIKGKSSIFLNSIFEILFKEENRINFTDDPKLTFETILMRLGQTKPLVSIDMLIKKIEILQKMRKKEKHLIEEERYIGGKKLVEEPNEYKEQNCSENHLLQDQLKAQSEVKPEAQDDDNENLWKKTLNIIEQESPIVASNLKESNLLEISDKSIKIEVKGSSFNINSIKRKKSLAIIEQSFSKITGKDLKVVIDSKIYYGKKEKADNNYLISEALNNHLVRDTLEIFGGTLKEGKNITGGMKYEGYGKHAETGAKTSEQNG